jgi:hypothetical protein
MKPASMNAFELISLSSGLDLSGLFEQPQVWQNMPPVFNFCAVQAHMMIRSVDAYFSFAPVINQSFVDHMLSLLLLSNFSSQNVRVNGAVLDLYDDCVSPTGCREGGDTLHKQKVC